MSATGNVTPGSCWLVCDVGGQQRYFEVLSVDALPSIGGVRVKGYDMKNGGRMTTRLAVLHKGLYGTRALTDAELVGLRRRVDPNESAEERRRRLKAEVRARSAERA